MTSSQIMRKLVPALVSASLAACAPNRAEVPTVTRNADFDVRVGGLARISDTDLLLRFDTVTEDSRCPTDVTCVWAGNATSRLTIDSAGKLRNVEFRTSAPQPASVFGTTFEFRSLRPPRHSESPPKPSDYIITLRVLP